MNIAVVTGASGFVGSHLVDHLLEKKYEVRCIVRRSSDLRWLKGKNVKIFDCGLFDVDGMTTAFKDANYIFHVAGVVKSKKPEGYFKGNVDTTDALLKAALNSASTIKKIVIVSSLTAVGPSLDGAPVTEETECKPITTYGRSKLAQEKLAAAYMNKLPITILRLHAVYGERDTEIFKVFQTYKMGLMTLVGFDEKRLNLVHVADTVDGIYAAAVSDKTSGQTYFIASEIAYTWPQVGDAFAKAFGRKAINVRFPHFLVYVVATFAEFFSMFSSKPATFNLEKAKDFVQKDWICDVSKAKRDFNFRQTVGLIDGIKRTHDWYRKMKWL
ncbi:MAG: NAD-dependent epimerase/dehydratase family protein [Ignavibacteriaceae bacterium]|nr:NAD-dependent epimerase/dehydratase family protein [Ignavibacteriaceae bacterium]